MHLIVLYYIKNLVIIIVVVDVVVVIGKLLGSLALYSCLYVAVTFSESNMCSRVLVMVHVSW